MVDITVFKEFRSELDKVYKNYTTNYDDEKMFSEYQAVLKKYNAKLFNDDRTSQLENTIEDITKEQIKLLNKQVKMSGRGQGEITISGGNIIDNVSKRGGENDNDRVERYVKRMETRFNKFKKETVPKLNSKVE